jgi:glutathione peroxidase
MATSIHQHQVTLNTGETIDLAEYYDKVILVVNTASECGFTSQYNGLEKLYQRYQGQGFVVLGFPCDQFGHQEPGNDEQIAQFCSMNFNLTFPLSVKVKVNGDTADPLYQTLTSQAPGLLGSKRIKWNFTKFLINKQGEVLKRYAPTTKPEDITSDIEAALSA